MINPLVSVVMPAYNVEKYIAASIESVINQTYLHWELLIVDDGSSDNTALIIKKYQLQDQRIKYFHQKNSGQSQARDLALKNSTGKYIAFLDADDLWLTKKLSISVEEICNNNFDLLFTDAYYFEDGCTDDVSNLKVLGVQSNIYQGQTGLSAFLESNKIPHLTVLVKKEVLLAAGDYLEIMVAEDYEMWLRLLYNNAIFRSIDSPLSIYRIRKESLTANDRLAIFETMVIIKLFAKQHIEYKKEINKILKNKLKYWLYNGYKPTKINYRKILLGMSPNLITFFLYLLSFGLSFKWIRKITNKIYFTAN